MSAWSNDGASAGRPEEGVGGVTQPHTDAEQLDGLQSLDKGESPVPDAAESRGMGDVPQVETNWFLARKEVVRTGRGSGEMQAVQAVLDAAMRIEGALGATLVDANSGMMIASAGEPEGLDLQLASAGNGSVVQAKLRTIHELGLDDHIEDIIITLGRQYHMIRTSPRHEGMFLYLVLDKDRSNLAMARYRLMQIERRLAL